MSRAAEIVAWAIILAAIAIACAPLFAHTEALGGHDWDTAEANRYLTAKTLTEHGQFPFWNPYACGGHPNWGNVEGGTTLVSPWLPVYLLAPLATALRIEVVGSALLAAIGTWLLSGRFTRSAAARAFVVVVAVVNGRWALQVAAGHVWHLAYAWTPWVLFFFDRATDIKTTRPLRDAALAGAALALMVYTGGIYPLPQAALVLAAYGVLVAITIRSARPLIALMVAGAAALGLSAPKLLPLLDVMARYPRYADSSENVDLGALVETLTARGQDLDSQIAPVPTWSWFEYGAYIGWPALFLLAVGTIATRGPRVSTLKWLGLGLVVLSLGSFHPAAPWSVLHDLPVFRSQHVPSRWLYLAPLLLGCAVAPIVDRMLRAVGRARGVLEAALLVGVAAISLDIATESRLPLSHAFTRELPARAAQPEPAFRQVKDVPASLYYTERDYYAPSLPAMMAGLGTLECATFPGLHHRMRQGDRGPGMGARGLGDPLYRGEAYTASGVGTARLVSFSPNAMVVEVEDAQPGDRVILNQNFDPGWTVDGARAEKWRDAVAAPITRPAHRFSFQYVPRLFWPGVGLLALTLAALFATRIHALVAAAHRRCMRWRTSA